MVMEGGRAILRDNLLAWSFGNLAFLGLLIWLGHNLPFYLMPRLNTWKRKSKGRLGPRPSSSGQTGVGAVGGCARHIRDTIATDTWNLKAQKEIQVDDFVGRGLPARQGRC